MTDSATKAGATARFVRAAAVVRSDVVLVLCDVLLLGGAYLGVLILRFNGAVPTDYWNAFGVFLPAAVAAHLAANWVWGLYGQMWRHASVQEARRVVLACFSATAVLTAIVLWTHPYVVPRSVLLGGLVATIGIGGLRFQARLFAFRRTAQRDALRVVVIGAGESGAAVVRDMLRSPEVKLLPVALLDDDPLKQGRAISGVSVVAGIDRLGEVVVRHRVDQALLAIPSADAEFVRRVASLADAAGVTLKVLPSISELVGGQVSVRDLRDLSITDLLGRQQVETDLESVRSIIHGRRVLITGAGGSIGSEIARQVAAFGPAELFLLDHDETHLHDVAASLDDDCHQVLADVRDRRCIDALWSRLRPQVVFHAAAHKHVPLLEAHPCEAVRTNVLGTRNVVAASARVEVERFVLVSTDKAVQPSSVMGASKAVCERIVLAQAPPEGRYCAVRFGNVLGSRGSVIPTFMRQIEAGGPVTVTDPRMTRFFMSIPEAVQLVLQAAAFSGGGEIFMLKMGQPVRIVDLAERMIRLSGRRVGDDVAIRITGARPGEKLEEELHTADETSRPTAHPSIVALQPPSRSAGELDDALDRFELVAAAFDDQAAARLLFSLTSAPRALHLVEHEPAHGRQPADSSAISP